MSIRLYFPHPDYGIRVPFSSNKSFQYQEGRTVCERGGYDFCELDPGTSGYRLEFPAEYEKWIQDPTTKTWSRDPDSFVYYANWLKSHFPMTIMYIFEDNGREEEELCWLSRHLLGNGIDKTTAKEYEEYYSATDYTSGYTMSIIFAAYRGKKDDDSNNVNVRRYPWSENQID